jgi:hypothetical protein
VVGCQWHQKKSYPEGCESLTRGIISDVNNISAGVGVDAFELVFNFPQKVEELYSVPQRFVEGQRIQVQEILRMYFSLVDPSVVDVDKRWFGNRPYIGTWRLNRNNLQQFTAQGDEGFITSEFFDIIRYSEYTVVPPPNVEQGTLGGVRLDDCNFLLEPVALNILSPLLLTGQGLKKKEGVLLGDLSIDYPFLSNQDFFPKISSCGLFINKGCELTRYEYIRSVVSEVYLLRPPVSPPVVCSTNSDPCDPLFAAYIFNDLFAGHFLTQAAAIAWISSIDPVNAPTLIPLLVRDDFVCPDGSTREAWAFAVSGG